MKKDSAFKLKSGNKPSISKMMGISPVKKTKNLPEGMVDFNNPAIRERYNTDKEFRDYLKKERGITYDEKTRTAKKVVSSFGKPFKPSPASKKKFRGARSAAAGQTAGQIIKRERLMI